jgi:hypothetical protein
VRHVRSLREGMREGDAGAGREIVMLFFYIGRDGRNFLSVGKRAFVATAYFAFQLALAVPICALLASVLFWYTRQSVHGEAGLREAWIRVLGHKIIFWVLPRFG